MSGSLRRAPPDEDRRKHDHAEWIFGHARFLLHDPRRFGAVLWHDAADGPIVAHHLLDKLGIEPSDELFPPEYLNKYLKRKTLTIHQALMAGHIVVGRGIYYV